MKITRKLFAIFQHQSIYHIGEIIYAKKWYANLLTISTAQEAYRNILKKWGESFWSCHPQLHPPGPIALFEVGIFLWNSISLQLFYAYLSKVRVRYLAEKLNFFGSNKIINLLIKHQINVWLLLREWKKSFNRREFLT